MEKDGGNVSKELGWLMLLCGSYANVCGACCMLRGRFDDRMGVQAPSWRA